jgi:tRNA nucleotidyltransferase (CCA-adding enzyme)
MSGINYPVASLVTFPQRWPFSISCLPPSTYLVGGAVRDSLLGRTPTQLDLDFVLSNDAVTVAATIARRYDAGFVLLDEERQIARVVFEQATADFALQVGPTLESDLQRRDFSINAIAYSPHTQKLYDPLGGYDDLQQGLIRMVSLENLREDPLRLLRAYRQAAQLGFTLEAGTWKGIWQLAHSLSTIAAERIQAELRYLLSSTKGTPWLKAAWKDGLLAHWLTHATCQSIERLSNIDAAVLHLEAQHPGFTRLLYQHVSDSAFAAKADYCQGLISSTLSDRNWLVITKLACLLSPNLNQASNELQRLKVSRAEIRTMVTLLKHLPCLLTPNLELSLKEQYYLFRDVGPVFPALVTLSIAVGQSYSVVAGLIQRFLDPADPVAHPTQLITGQDLMTALALQPGPKVGQLLAAIQLAHAEGKISTSEDALQYSAQLLEAGD